MARQNHVSVRDQYSPRHLSRSGAIAVAAWMCLPLLSAQNESEELSGLVEFLKVQDSSKIEAVIEAAQAHLKKFSEGKSAEYVQYALSYSLFRKKDYPKAIESFTTFLEKYPESARNSVAHFYRAESYNSSNQKKKALPDFQAASEGLEKQAHQQTAHAMWHIGDLLNQQGKKADAKKVLEKLKKNYAGNSYARKASTLLKRLGGSGAVTVAATGTLQAGKPALDFEGQTIDGKSLKLSDYRGKVVLLDFWATWCGPCRAELPNVRAVYNNYKDKNFEIISISLDKNADTLKQFVKKEGMNWPQVFDGKGWKNAVAQLYGVRSIPRMYLLDEQGVIRYEKLRGKSLEDAVKKLVEK